MENEVRLNKWGYPFAMKRRCCPEKKELAAWMRYSPTLAERRLWERLSKKAIGYRFRRQVLVYGWIADFFCPSTGLIIEVDGSVHEARGEKEKDILRDSILNQLGFMVARFTNHDVIHHPDDVILQIKNICDNRKQETNQ